jgi:hypothetical protein
VYRVAYKKLIFVLAVLFVLSGYVPVSSLYKTTEGKISFKSEANLELIKASSNDLVGAIDTLKRNFSFKVPISSFEGFNSRTQREHFNENYMQTEKYPDASFKGKIIEDIDLSKDGAYVVRAKGMLNIHGVEKERIIKSDLIIRNRIFSLKSNFTVLLSDHDIPIPKVVYQKLANEIKVEVSANLQPR